MTRSLPEDPLIRSLVVQARRAQLTRRTMLAGAGAGATALALAACAPSGSTKPTPPPDNSANDKTLIWANWALYLDEDDAGNHPTLEQFIADTGIQVDYKVDVDDNNSYYGKVKDQLALGQDIGADTVCLTDWMVSRWIRFGYTQTLDDANIPNKANLNPDLLNVDFDPGRTQSLPVAGRLRRHLLEQREGAERPPQRRRPVEPRAQGPRRRAQRDARHPRPHHARTTASTSPATGATTSSTPRSTSSASRSRAARSATSRATRTSRTCRTKTRSPRSCWSGDITALNAEAGDKWEFAIPDGGGTLWNDNFLIPIGSPRKANAEALINYYYDPEIAAEVAAWVNYITPVVGRQGGGGRPSTPSSPTTS